MDGHTMDIIVAIVGSILASSGFWALIQNYLSKNDSSRKLLLGLAHDRMMYLGRRYIDRGYVTPEDYENLVTYLYEPYCECGGNGSVKHIMDRVKLLEVKT